MLNGLTSISLGSAWDFFVESMQFSTGILGLTSGALIVLLLSTVFFIVSAKDAIWAYKENNKVVFSRCFVLSSICGIIILWNLL